MDIELFKSLRRNLVFVAMLELVSGLFLIIFNSRSLEIIIKLLGIIAAAYGIVTFLTWLVRKDKSGGFPIIATAVLGVAAGVLLISFSKRIEGVFMLIAGIFAGVFGVLKLPNMFSIKKAGVKKWAIELIPIALIVGIGIFVGLNALGDFSSHVISILLGAALIIGCAADIITIGGASTVEKALRNGAEINVSMTKK